MALCDFHFVCGKDWDELAPTNSERARHCNECDKHVFIVDGRDQMVVASALGRCAAERRVLFEDMTVGGLIAFDVTDVSLLVSLRLPLTGSRIAMLRKTFPAIFDAAANEANLISGGVVQLQLNSMLQISILEHELDELAPELDMAVVSPRNDEPRELRLE